MRAYLAGCGLHDCLVMLHDRRVVLLVQQCSTVVAALHRFTAAEQLSGTNAYKCGTCNRCNSPKLSTLRPLLPRLRDSTLDQQQGGHYY